MSDQTPNTAPEGGESLGCGCDTASPLLPQASFSTFVMSLYSSCMVHLGECPDPTGGDAAQDLAMAKHTIDVLAMLQDKTAKNLDDGESKLLADALYQLRMLYVAKTK